MRTLHLTLKKKWFDMIASGEKKEEYREMKPYWRSRLLESKWVRKNYTHILFKNGYAKDARSITVVYKDLFECAEGRPDWGAEPGKKYFVIKLGERIHTHSERGNLYVTPFSEGVVNG